MNFKVIVDAFFGWKWKTNLKRDISNTAWRSRRSITSDVTYPLGHFVSVWISMMKVENNNGDNDGYRAHDHDASEIYTYNKK